MILTLRDKCSFPSALREREKKKKERKKEAGDMNEEIGFSL